MAYSFNEIVGSLGLIISCGAAVLLVKLLMSNTMQQEKFFNALGRCHTELESSSKKLETLCAVLDRRFANMQEAAQQTDPLLINTLHNFDKVSKELRDRLDDLFLPTPTGAAKPGNTLPNESVLQEISKLQSGLEEITNQLRRGNYLSMDENAEMAAMRKRIESYQSMVMKARAEAKESEGVMASLKDEITRLSNLTAKAPPSSSADVATQETVQELTKEKQALETKLAALQDELKRHTIEKEFIEERFMDLS
jgi:predicted  nucleic acid-binding Zn-ribbon protein